MRKITLFFLTIFLTTLTLSVNIDGINTFQSSYGHDDTIMLDGEIKNADEVYYRAYVDGELVKTDQMYDSVGDGYYASPTGIVTEGNQVYKIEVTAYGNGGEDSKSLFVETSCKIGIFDSCFY